MKNRCPYLEETRSIRSCAASRALLIPSIDRYESRCSTDDHYRCPILMGHVMRSGRAAVERRHAMESTRWSEK